MFLLFPFWIIGTVQVASNIKLYSDGGADLITFEDKEVIHLSKEQLGTYLKKVNSLSKVKRLPLPLTTADSREEFQDR